MYGLGRGADHPTSVFLFELQLYRDCSTSYSSSSCSYTELALRVITVRVQATVLALRVTKVSYCSMIYVQPAVNRQPGYRREDS